jgi:tripartite-type tricarboxylate transporter receptor subunit TctC
MLHKFLIFIFLSIYSTIGLSSQQIEYTVHHAPGGVSDKIARLITKELPTSEYIVQNRPGGAGRIAMRQVLKGDSALLATVPQIFVTNPLSFKDLEYNPDTDLEIVGTVGILTNLLVCNTKAGINNFSALVNTPKSLSFAIGGYGGSDHIATELLLTHLKGKHVIVPYSGGGNKSALDVLGGTVDCTFGNYATVKPFMKDERVVVLFASHDMGDNVLTWENYFKETFPYQSFISLVVSKSMEQEKKAKIIRDITTIWKKKEFKELMFNTGILPILNTEPWSTNSVLKSNRDLRKFITNNNILLGN